MIPAGRAPGEDGRPGEADRPLMIVEQEGGQRGGEGFERVVAGLERRGLVVHRGFDYGRRSWGLEGSRVVCVGEVDGPHEAAAAVHAAARGAGVVAAVDPGHPELVERLYEDLRRLGLVELRSAAAGGPLDVLDPEQRRLLDLLAGGATLDEAAAELNYSRRTVNRRLAAIRGALGVRTTSEALLLVRREQPAGG